MMSLLTSIMKQVQGVADFVVIAAMAAVGTLFLAPSWRGKLHYVPAAILLGCIAGFFAEAMFSSTGLGILFTAVVTITAPATIMTMEGKSASEILEAMQSIVKRDKGK